MELKNVCFLNHQISLVYIANRGFVVASDFPDANNNRIMVFRMRPTYKRSNALFYRLAKRAIKEYSVSGAAFKMRHQQTAENGTQNTVMFHDFKSARQFLKDAAANRVRE